MVAEVRSDDFVAGIATALSRMFEPWFIPPDISLWKPHESIPKSGGYQHFLSLCKKHGGDLNGFCDNLAEQRGDRISEVFSFDRHSRTARGPTLVASITEPVRLGKAHGATGDEDECQEAQDSVGGLTKEFRKFQLTGPSGSPSQNCKPHNYLKYQRGPIPILDGRYAADTPTTIAHPVEDFHYAFASFVAEYRDENTQLPEEFVRKVGALMDAVSVIDTDGSHRESDTRALLSNLLAVAFGRPVNSTRMWFSADHLLNYRREDSPLGVAALAIIEEHIELGVSGDGSVQGSFSYAQHWAHLSQKALSKACFCPSFVIAIAGPYIVICGAIVLGRPVVQRLTDYIWLANSRINDDTNALRIARVFFALGNALTRLRSFYVNDVQPAKPLAEARYFPLANRAKIDERVVEFKYLRHLKDGAQEACVTFLAEECEGDKRKLVVKFVERYGVAAHELLAKHGLAPRLLSYGDIWLSGPEQRGCGSRKMVVMEYVEGCTADVALYDSDEGDEGALPEGVPGVVERAVKILHDADMVHGDIRLGNVLIAAGDDDVGARVKIVDFDWAGEAGVVRYPLHLSTVINWPNGVADYALITKAHDDEMVRRVATSLAV
ncbi:hypothetical protein K466DRAFT_542114 [Polyporus arcularius HHB13444]|uniref:Protein kinase domain-containing protein n=1 Tax=Polyporus arcularius HHB13444 TaxID=1314778 RepID=A0A5C3PPD1_9APHY|nr:hypothetical protein K466DRAFT_542114 [Polyporus arcularius HHB13444]